MADHGYEVELATTAERDAPTATNPRWLVAIGAVVLLALGAIVAIPGVESEPDPAPPPPVQTSTTLPTEPIPEPADLPEPGSNASAIRLLTDPESLTAPFSLVELSQLTSGEHSVRLVALDGRSAAANNPVVLGATQWPAWPGATTRPFLVAASTVIYPSRGEIVAIDIETGESIIVGSGLAVIDGLDSNEFWVVEAGERSVSRYRLDGGIEHEPFDFAGNGRALTAAGDGLVVAPPIESGLGRLAHWSPTTGLTAIPAPSGYELLGGTEDLVMLTNGTNIVSYNLSSGVTTEAAMEGEPDAQRGALSPDGSLLALAQRHPLTSLGRISIIDTVSGALRATLPDVVDREFAWTSDETLVTVGYDGQEFQVIEFNVASELRTPVAAVTYPWIYVAVATNS